MPLKSTCEKIKKTYLFYLKIREWALANNDQVLVLNWFDRKHKARKRPLRHIYCGHWWKSALFLPEQTSRWYHAIEYQWTLCSNWNIDWKIVNKNSKFKIFRKNCKKKFHFLNFLILNADLARAWPNNCWLFLMFACSATFICMQNMSPTVMMEIFLNEFMVIDYSMVPTIQIHLFLGLWRFRDIT